MKKLFLAVAILFPLIALGAYRENPITTNTPAGMSNVIFRAAAGYGFISNNQATVTFGTVGATTVNGTTVNATTVGATTVNAPTVNATNVGASTITSTTVSATTVNATTANATNLNSGTAVITNLSGGTATFTNLNATQTATFSNLFLLYPQWVDIPMNYGFSVTGPNAPSLTVVSPTSPVQGLAFDNGDILYAQGQWQHSVADTNALYPQFIIHPHVHFSTVGAGLPDATHSNVTWKIEWEWASLNQFFTNAWSTGTNTVTVGVYTNYMHYLANLGPITNTVPPGISAIFRCRLTRPASGLRDYSNAHDVIMDAMDVHIPIGNVRILGSRTDSAP